MEEKGQADRTFNYNRLRIGIFKDRLLFNILSHQILFLIL